MFSFFSDNNGEMDDYSASLWNNLYDFLVGKNINDKSYLTIKNSWNEDVEFCITKNDASIPYSNFLITVFWHYGDMEVWLQSVVKKWVPDWTLNVLDQVSPS